MKKSSLFIFLILYVCTYPLLLGAQNNRFYLDATIDYEAISPLDIMDFANDIVVYSFAKSDEAQAALNELNKNVQAKIDNAIRTTPSENGTFKVMAFRDGSLLIWVKDKRYASRVFSGRKLSAKMNIVITPANRKQKKNDRVTIIVNQNENSIGDTIIPTIEVIGKKDIITREASSSQDEGGVMVSSSTFRIPFRVKSNMRIVVQPVWYDRIATTDESPDTVFSYGRPLFCDFSEYNITQTRKMDYNMSNDVLYNVAHPDSLYMKKGANGEIVRSEISITPRKDTIIISVIDTLSGYDPDVSHPYPFGVLVAVADYNTKLLSYSSKDDGERKSPLKFLDFTFRNYMPDDEFFEEHINDEPTDCDGELRLNFDEGEATISMKDSVNISEINKLRALLNEIERDEFRSLITMDVYGVASPDGTLQQNKELARRRAEYAKSQIQNFTNRPVEIADTKVAGWDEVAALLRNDSLYAKADTIDAIIASVEGIEAQYRKIKNLPFYPLLAKEYLPKLRVVRYSYLENKPAQPEPANLLASFYNEEQRRNFEHGHYWILFKYVKDEKELERVARCALKETRSQDEDSIYCNGYWAYAASLLASCYIARDTVDLNLLTPFLDTRLVKNDSSGALEIQNLRDWWPSRIHKRITKGNRSNVDKYRIVKYINFPEIAANQLVMLLRSKKKLDFKYVSALEDIMAGQGLRYDTLASLSKCMRGGYKETYFTTAAQAEKIRSIVESTSETNAVIINLAMDDCDDADSTYLRIADFKSQALPDNAVSCYLKAIINFRKAEYADADSLLALSFTKDLNMVLIANNDKDLVSLDRSRYVIAGALSRWKQMMRGVVGSNEENAFAWFVKAIDELEKGERADVEKSRNYMFRCFDMDKRYFNILGVMIKRDKDVKKNTLLSDRLNEIRNEYYKQ